MKSKQGYSSFWHNRLQGALFLLAFLTWGLGDALTSLWMIEHRGIMGEANIIARCIIINYGASSFITIKIWFTSIVLFFIPFLIQKRSQEPVYWMINGYFCSFFFAGALAMILNIQAAQNEALLISPELVIFLFLSSIFILTSIGEEIDKRTNPRIRSYFDCFLYDIAKVRLSLIILISNPFIASKDAQIIFGRVMLAKAIKASIHNAIFPFVSLMFENILLIDYPFSANIMFVLIINKCF